MTDERICEVLLLLGWVGRAGVRSTDMKIERYTVPIKVLYTSKLHFTGENSLLSRLTSKSRYFFIKKDH